MTNSPSGLPVSPVSSLSSQDDNTNPVSQPVAVSDLGVSPLVVQNPVNVSPVSNDISSTQVVANSSDDQNQIPDEVVEDKPVIPQVTEPEAVLSQDEVVIPEPRVEDVPVQTKDENEGKQEVPADNQVVLEPEVEAVPDKNPVPSTSDDQLIPVIQPTEEKPQTPVESISDDYLSTFQNRVFKIEEQKSEQMPDEEIDPFDVLLAATDIEDSDDEKNSSDDEPIIQSNTPDPYQAMVEDTQVQVNVPSQSTPTTPSISPVEDIVPSRPSTPTQPEIPVEPTSPVEVIQSSGSQSTNSKTDTILDGLKSKIDQLQSVSNQEQEEAKRLIQQDKEESGELSEDVDPFEVLLAATDIGEETPAEGVSVTPKGRERQAVSGGIPESLPTIEMNVDKEAIPEDMEQWVEVKPDDMSLDTLPELKAVEDDFGDIIFQSSQVTKPNIVLPIVEEEIQKGLHQKVGESIRWMAEWCNRVIKIFPNRVFYKKQ